MPESWAEERQLVHKQIERNESCIEKLIEEQVDQKVNIAVGKAGAILYGLVSVLLGTLISVLMQRLW